MRFTARELLLAWLTAAVVLFVATWLILSPRVAGWKAIRGQQRDARNEIDRNQRLVAQAPQWSAQLAEIMRTLPSYPPGKDVTADLLIRIENHANAAGVTLERRDAQKEEQQGELYKLAIVCRWSASLEALTRFLHAIQSDAAMLDISQLTIAPDAQGNLKGGFTVDGAYSRTAAAAGQQEPAGSSEQPPTTGTGS